MVWSTVVWCDVVKCDQVWKVYGLNHDAGRCGAVRYGKKFGLVRCVIPWCGFRVVMFERGAVKNNYMVLPHTCHEFSTKVCLSHLYCRNQYFCHFSLGISFLLKTFIYIFLLFTICSKDLYFS